MKLHKLISTVDMSHEEWLRYRKLGIGGSDAGSICGLNPYSSAKVVLDALNGIAYHDDTQIIKLSVTKAYKEEAYLSVTLMRFDT